VEHPEYSLGSGLGGFYFLVKLDQLGKPPRPLGIPPKTGGDFFVASAYFVDWKLLAFGTGMFIVIFSYKVPNNTISRVEFYFLW